MSKENNVELKGVGQWLYLIRRFHMMPHEALENMHEHNQDVSSILKYLEAMLNSFTFNSKVNEV